MNEKQNEIWKYLQTNALGKSNPIKMRNLAAQVGIPAYGSNDQNLRYLIREMVVVHRLPIGTSSRGCFIILSEDDRNTSVQYLQRNFGDRIIALNEVDLYNPQ
jgi:hypothetical protein